MGKVLALAKCVWAELLFDFTLNQQSAGVSAVHDKPLIILVKGIVA